MTRRMEQQFKSNGRRLFNHPAAVPTPGNSRASTAHQTVPSSSSALAGMSSGHGNTFGDESFGWINSPNHRRHRHPELIFTEQQALAELWSPTMSLSGSTAHDGQVNRSPLGDSQGIGIAHGEHSCSTQQYTLNSQPATSSRGHHPTSSALVVSRRNCGPEYYQSEQPLSIQSYTTASQSRSSSEHSGEPTSLPLAILYGHGIPVFECGEQSTFSQPYTPKARAVSSSSPDPHPISSPLVIRQGHGITVSGHPPNPFTPRSTGKERSSDVNQSSWESSTETYAPSGSNYLKKKRTSGRPWPEKNPFADPLPMSVIMRAMTSESEYPKRLSQTQRPQSRERLERELRARQIAIEQDRKLRKARTEYHQLRVTSRQVQTTTTSTRAVTTFLTPKKSLHCWPFWVSFLIIQIGGTSTAAAVPVVVNNQKHGHRIAIGNGVIFWLVISIVTTVAGLFFCFIIVVRRHQCSASRWFSAFRDETDDTASRPAEPDIERGSGPDAYELSTCSTLERRRAAHAQLLDENQMPIVRAQLRDPMWYALYSQPEGVEEYISLVEPPHHNSELLNSANSDIGVQVHQPSQSKEKIIQQQVQISPPPLAKINPVNCQDDRDSITPGQSTSMKPAKRPSGAATYFGSSREEVPLGYGSKFGIGKDEVVLRSEDDEKLGNASRRSIVGSELRSFSPLEDLARDLSRKEVLEMQPKERAEYLTQRQRQSGKRSLRTRASMVMERMESRGVGRWPTVSAYGFVGDENGDGIELAALKEQEGYLADIDNEQTDNEGDKRARYGTSMQSEGKVQRLRRMWEEGEAYNGSMGSRCAS